MTCVIVVAAATDPLGFSGDVSAQLAYLLLGADYTDGFLVVAAVVPAPALPLMLHQSPNKLVAPSEV